MPDVGHEVDEVYFLPQRAMSVFKIGWLWQPALKKSILLCLAGVFTAISPAFEQERRVKAQEKSEGESSPVTGGLRRSGIGKAKRPLMG